MKIKALLAIAATAALLPLGTPAQAGGWCGLFGIGCNTTPPATPTPSPTPVPEPSDAVLLLLGVAGVAIGRRMQARKR